jgi:hypothetical protein
VPKLLLSTINLTTGDVRRLAIDYSDFLPQGYQLTGVTPSITPATASSTVTQTQIDPDSDLAWIWVKGGTVLNEQFTLLVVATDNFGEVLNDQINFTVVAPGATS